MRKLLIVARREYLALVKTKMFIVTLVLMPVFMGGAILAQELLKDKVDLTDKRVGIIDHTGVVYDYLAQAAAQRNASAIFKSDGAAGESRQTAPRYLLERVRDEEARRSNILAELSERVRQKKLFAFLVIDKDVLQPGTDERAPFIRYYSNTPTHDDLRQWLCNRANESIHKWRFAHSGLDEKAVHDAMRWADISNLGLVTIDATTGEVVEAQKVDQVTTFAVPAIAMLLMWMVIMTGASPLVQSVLEEKMQRIAEVLLGSIDPFLWMMGKLLGMVGVALTVVAVYLAGLFVVADHYGVMDAVPLHLLGWFVAFQAAAIMMFGAVFLAVGAACTDHKEAQSAIMPVMLVVVAPMFVWVNVLKEPASTFSTLVSFFPPATPMLMILRQCIPPGIPVWQPLLGLLLVVATTVLCIFVAGRIFRVGILVQGKGARLGEMARWVVRG